jgi:hypothetical protein
MTSVIRSGNDGKTLRILRTVVLIIVIFFAMVWLRAFYGSMKAYRTGEEMLKQRQLIRAVTYFDRSIHWYTPLNPYVENSARRLWEIGERAKKEGDIKMALIAFRAIRAGFYSASHFTTPGRDWIEKSEAMIRTLTLKEEKERASSKAVEESAQAKPRTGKGSSPDVFWTVVLEVGFLGWVGSLFAFIFVKWGPRKDSAKLLYKTLAPIGSAVGFFVIWIIGMMRA